MANKKEYEMLFQLNAQMNGGFSGTFSKAQAEFTRLGKEVQSLHKIQGDIASYQKQQSAIENTRAKLESLQKQHDLLQKEIEETTGSTAGLEREKVKLEERIKNTEGSLERQNQKLQTTETRLEEAGVDTANLAQKDQELTAKIKELEAAQGKAADGAVSFGEKSAQAFGTVQQAIAAAGVAVALKEIADAYMECVGVAADFEEVMSTVEALSQANAQEMAALSEQAKELGATTKFTAKEAGDAMGYMAMAGWDANDMLQGMDGVLQLAAASGEDLAMVSDIVTDSLSAFGLTAKDTAHFSDVLAAAATNSNTNVSIMGETFKMSASVAGALGYSIEDVAVAMGLMANSGVKGSIAGTALRNTFNGLLEGVTLTGAAFGEYEYSAIKADGTMKDFGATVNELRGYFDQMTEAERVHNAQAIAGQRGYNGLLAILNATDADYVSLTNSINNCTGAAQRMANVKLDNLNGQLTLMDSAWDALRTTIGEEFNPELRALAEIATDLLGWINSFVKQHPALVKGVMTFTGVVGGATVAVMGVNAALKIFNALNVAAMFTGPVGAILGGVAAVAGLTAAVVGLVTAANEGVPSVKELTEAARDMKDAMEDAGLAFEETTTKTIAAVQVADTYIAKLEELGEGTEAADNHSQTYLNTLSLLCNAIPELAGYVDLETGAIEGGTEALRAHTEAWKENAEAQAYQEYMNSLMDDYNAVMVEAAENEIKLTQAQIKEETASKGMQETYQQLLATLGMTEEQFKSYYGTVQDIPYRSVSKEVAALRSEYIEYSSQLTTAQKEQRNLAQAIEEGAEAVAEAETVLDDAQEAYYRLTGVTEEQTEAEAEAARQTQELQAIIGDTAERVAALVEAYNDAYGAALDSISGQYALWDEAAKVVEVSAGSINNALESQIAYWQDYNTNLASLRERTGDIEGLSDVIASFADGSQDSVNAIAGLANASDEDLRAMVTNWQELQKEQEAAAGSVADLKTDFTETMDELQAELAEDIDAMDLGDEAAEAGRATLQGYIDGANSMLPQVQAAYKELARAASSALGTPSYSNSAYYANNNRGYASGTKSAEPGWAMVGENGPELMFFNGGEQVLNAAETSAMQSRASSDIQMMTMAPQLMAMLNTYSGHGVGALSAELGSRGASTNISVSVPIQVTGNAGPDTLDALRDLGNKLADTVTERVMDALEEERIDAARRAY